jgi:hypothetical protein
MHSGHAHLLIVWAGEKCGGLSTATGAALIFIFIATVVSADTHMLSRTEPVKG